MIPLGPAMAEAIVSRRKQISKTKPATEPKTTKPVQTRKRTALLIPAGPSKLAKPKQSDLLPKKSQEEIYYTCELCPMAFNKKFNRDRHMEVMHGVAVSTRNRPLYPDKIQDTNPIPEPKPPMQELPLPAKAVLKKAMDPTKTVEPKPTKLDPESDVEPESDEDIAKPESDVESAKQEQDVKPESDVEVIETDVEPTTADVEPMETTNQESCDNSTMLQKPLNKEVCVTILVTTK